MTQRIAVLTKAQISPTLLSEKEHNLVVFLRSVRFGRVEIIMANGQPDHVVKVTESIKL